MNRLFVLALLLYTATAKAEPLPCMVIHNDGNSTNFLGTIAYFSIPTCNSTANLDVISRQIVEEPDNFFILSGFKKFAGRYLFGNSNNQSLFQNIFQKAFQQANTDAPSFPQETTNPIGMQIGYAALIIASSALLYELYFKQFNQQEPNERDSFYNDKLSDEIFVYALLTSILNVPKFILTAISAHHQKRLVQDAKLGAHFPQLAEAQNALTWSDVSLMLIPFETLTALSISNRLVNKKYNQLHFLIPLGFSMALTETIGILPIRSTTHPDALASLLLLIFGNMLWIYPTMYEIIYWSSRFYCR